MRLHLAALLLGALALAPGLARAQGGLVAYYTFDDPVAGRFVTEQVSETLVPVISPFHPAEFVQGVEGMALRLDGYSTWVSREVPEESEPSEALGIQFWTAVENYPVTGTWEGPKANGAFVNQYTYPGSGYLVGMDSFGRWYFAASINGQWETCWANTGAFPKDEWVHVAASYSQGDGMRLYLNGELVGQRYTANAPITVDDDTPLTIGKNVHEEYIADLFPVGLIRGMMDEVQVYDRALTAGEIGAAYAAGAPVPEPDFSIPETRFQDDNQRPQFHAQPASSWTNEPHGLVYDPARDEYHLFFQYNPQGPYWEQIHWGHLRSDDLVTWEPMPIALAPEPGYDQRGIWSGDAVIDDGTPTLLYTAVDGGRATVALATSHDGWQTFQKEGVVIDGVPSGYADYRDPYVWKDGDTWYLIIGAGIPGGGGTALLYRSPDLRSWTFLGPMLTGEVSQSGDYWEMPLFVPVGEDKHALLVSTLGGGEPARELYWVGTWENEQFVPDHAEPRQLDIINHMLSPGIGPDEDGRIIAMGIVAERRSSEQQLGAGYAHTYSLPREIYLLPDGTLGQRPLPALQQLRQEHASWSDLTIDGAGGGHLTGIGGERLEIKAEIDPGTAQTVGLELRRSPDRSEVTRLYYRPNEGTITLDLSQSSLNGAVTHDVLEGEVDLEPGEPIELHVFLDHSVIDVFVNGRAAFSSRLYPSRRDADGIDLYTVGGTATATSVDVWTLDALGQPVGIEDQGNAGSGADALGAAYPNPAHGAVQVPFHLEEAGRVRLAVYDVLGREVAVLADGRHGAGAHEATWSGADAAGRTVAPGVYLVRLQTPSGQAATRTLVRLR